MHKEHSLGGYTVVPTASPLNPAMVPAVAYEYLLCLPSSELPQPPARWKARGATVEVLYQEYRGSLVTSHKFGYKWFPPVASA
jgi:hypothetical protein